MKIEFENGSVIEMLETSSTIRGKGIIYWIDEKDEENAENGDS